MTGTTEWQILERAVADFRQGRTGEARSQRIAAKFLCHGPRATVN